MSLLEDLKKEVADVFYQKWDVIEGRAVPEDPAKVPFGNRGVSQRENLRQTEHRAEVPRGWCHVTSFVSSCQRERSRQHGPTLSIYALGREPVIFP